MYFVHPQIEISFENLKKILLSFFSKKPNIEGLKKMFPGKSIFFTDLGRTAFKLILEKFKLKGTEMILPAFICDIFFPILKNYNIQPIFVDVEKETFEPKIEEILKKVTENTRSILICHTFGLPFDVKELNSKIGNKVLIIEDCAHAFSAKIGNKFCGNFGKASFFSLYKQFPVARGGMVVIENERCEKEFLKETNFNLRDFLSLLNHFSCFAYIFKKLGGKIAEKIQRDEKRREIQGINKVSLNLFFGFLEDFEQKLSWRINLALFFQEKLKELGFAVQKSENNIFTIFSSLCPKNLNRDEFVKKLRKKGIFATRIWRKPIVLNPLVQKEYKIKIEDFPNTLEISKRIVNFPLQNYYTKSHIEKMVSNIKIILKELI